MIEEKFSKNSSNERLFNKIRKKLNGLIKLIKVNYEKKSLKKNEEKKRSRKRKRKIIWFNPPYCESVRLKYWQNLL